MTDLAVTGGAVPIEHLIARQRLEDITAQLGRSLLPIVATDTLVAYLIHLHGMTAAAIIWWIVIVAWTTRRRMTLGRWRDPPDARLMATLQRMRWMAGGLGALRAVPVVLLFAGAGADEATRLLVSMVMIGLAAGRWRPVAAIA